MPIDRLLLEQISSNSAEIDELSFDDQSALSSEAEFNELLCALKTNTQIRKLTIIGTTTFSLTNEHISQLCQLPCPFEELHIGENVFNDDAIDDLLKIKTLKKLTMNPSTRISIFGFYKFLQPSSLENLFFWIYDRNCSYNNIDTNQLQKILLHLDVVMDLETLANAMAGNPTSVRQIYIKFNERYKGDLDATQEKLDINTFFHALFEILNDLVSVRLEDNKADSDPLYALELPKKREREKNEAQAVLAIKSGDVELLRQTIPLLKNGVNTDLLEYGYLLRYSMSVKQPKVTMFLLNHGARTEVHEREYTPLFTAAERGDLEHVTLFLNYGANITGEFYFNHETALSIAAMKFVAATRGLLYELKETLNQQSSFFSFIERALNIANKYADTLEYYDAPPNIMFANDPKRFIQYPRIILIILKNLGSYHHLMNEKFLKGLKKTNKLALIYQLIYNKFAIIMRWPLLEFDIFSYLTFRREHRLSPITPMLTSAQLSKQQLGMAVARLNRELTSQKESAIDWKTYPSLYIAQFRGIHYFTHYFDEQQRKDHVYTIHLGRLAPAPAVYFMSSLAPSAHQLTRESEAEKHMRALRVEFAKLFNSGEVTGKNGKKYQSFGHLIQERMSNYYKQYQNDIKARENTAYEILDELGAHGYPHYATSDFPDHALRYGLGLKNVKSLAEHTLTPEYDENGKPKFPILGKIFVSLMSPQEMFQTEPVHVLGEHNRSNITLACAVAPERETSFPGGLEPGYVFYEVCLEVPDFSQWHHDYYERFGLTSEQFRNFQTTLKTTNHEERKNTERSILEHVHNHLTKKLLTLAQEEAQLRGGYLVFRNIAGQYSLTPEPILRSKRTRESFIPKREQEILAAIGRDNLTSHRVAKKRKKETAPTAPFDGLGYQVIPGDGHCLYSAVALYLGTDQQRLRSEVAGYLYDHKDEYMGIISALNTTSKKTIDEYIDDVRDGREWADNLEISILMKRFERPIIVIDSSWTIRNKDAIEQYPDGEPIFVYYNGHNHYDALIITDIKLTGVSILEKMGIKESEKTLDARNKKLFDAISENDVEKAKKLISSKRIDYNYINDEGDGDPLLVHAINLGRSRIARMLIEAGANVNLGNDGSCREKFMVKTPLWCAIGLEMNSSSSWHASYLPNEDRSATLGLTELLITRGANVNQVSEIGTSPLSSLLFNKSNNKEKVYELYQLLINNGASIESLATQDEKEAFTALESEITIDQRAQNRNTL